MYDINEIEALIDQRSASTSIDQYTNEELFLLAISLRLRPADTKSAQALYEQTFTKEEAPRRGRPRRPPATDELKGLAT